MNQVSTYNIHRLASAIGISAALLLAGSGGAGAQEEFIIVTGKAQTESAVSTRDGSAQKIELSFQPEVEISLPSDFRLTAIGRFRGDIRDRLEPGDPKQDSTSPLSRRLLIGDHADLELREAYLSGPAGPFHLTVGKQQIVWGQADGLKVLDVVNPQDFREFILDDFADSRIPLWSLNAEISVGDFNAQLIWIPDQTYNDLPEAGALYALRAPRFLASVPAGAGVIMRPPARPNNFLADSDAGFRLSGFLDGWDVTANYLYHHIDQPAPFRTLATGPGGTVATVVPRFKRSHLVGGTFSNAFGDFVVRGETGYAFNRFLPAANTADADGVVETDQLMQVLGLDWSGLSDTLVSLQLFLDVLTAGADIQGRDRLESTVTVLLRRSFLDDKAAAEVIWLQSVDHGDGLVRPKISYEFGDALEVWLGADIFYGRSIGIFGQFSRNDRVTAGARWSF